MRNWLSRLAFSFIIIGCVLLWEAYKSSTRQTLPPSPWRITLYTLAAACSFSLGIAGLRMRHRRP
jgi:hypothetical protein